MTDPALTLSRLLEQLLTTSQKVSPQKILFVSPQGDVTIEAWLQRVALWQQHIQQYPQCQRWALYHHDCAEFSAILFALWSSNKIACLPGNNNSGTQSLLAQRCDGFLGQFEPISELLHYFHQPDNNGESLAPTTTEFDAEAPLLEVFTSGSTGQPEAIGKNIRQLESELNALETVFSTQLNSCQIFSSVSHQHIYGLLFRVLWPLAAGRASYTETVETIEGLNHKVAQPVALVSSPTHLSRLPGQLDWQNLQQQVQLIFSSGAPLQEQHSNSSHELFSADVYEVYGSSETGGVAWRSQHKNGPLWQPLPGVDVRCGNNHCLEIRSGHLPDDDWFQSSDRVEFDQQQRFLLKGRVDQIVKVEGKRLSLTAMQQQLENNPLISEARVLIIEGKRSEVAVVATLTSAGRQALNENGKRPLTQQLRQDLFAYFERPLLPRRWRFPDDLPRNNQGKVTHADLMELFMSEPKKTLPDVVSQQLTGDEAQLTLNVSSDILYFDGHFEQQPILPGVTQVHWAAHFGKQLLGIQGEFQQLKNIKFMQVLTPGQEVQLSISKIMKDAQQSIRFRFNSATETFSSGELVFAN